MKRFLISIIGLAMALTASAQNFQPSDTTRVLLIGNSFTYYNNSWNMLSRIASSEGHELQIVHATQPGYSFADHLKSQETTDAILKGDYKIAILQDQSQTPAKYASDPKGNVNLRNNFITLTNRIYGWSPYVKIIMECTWAYNDNNCGGFGTLEQFDQFLQNGTRLYAEVIRGTVSPIGDAFAIVRLERPDIKLYDKDECHPSEYGTYLKCCVNYLTMFGGKFSPFTTSCDLDPEITKYLRSVAKKVVK